MNGMNVKLQAVKENKSKVVSASKLHQLVVEDSFCYMLQLLPCSAEAVCCSVTIKELEDPVMTEHKEYVLQEFQEVFETPIELPPFRGIHDHQIVLKEGSNPVSLRPYRYPPAQKDIIDGMVRELLDSGDRHPVAFISKVLSPKNRLLLVYDRELLALVHAVSKWHQYLSLNTFTILTDQHSLKYLLEQRLSTPAQYRWVTKLMGLSYEILYKKGKDNVAADALSRASHGEVLQLTISSISSELWDSLLKSYEHDSALQGLKLQVLSNPTLHPHFSVLDNLLYRKQKLVIPNDGQVRLVILQWLHSSHQGGHSGIRASIARIKSMFYWKGLAKDVTKFIQQCETCLRCKYEPRVVAGLLQPLPSLTTAYHPQSDGQSEVLNRCLEHYLRAMTWQRPKEWVNWLPLAEWWYNTTYHSAIQATPYEIVYGQAPPLHLPYCPQSTKVEAVDRSFIVREEMIQKLQGNLVRAQARMKRQADKHRSDREFKEGDWVLHRVGKVAYTLILPSTSRIHPTFHVSLLKPCPDENIPVVELPKEWDSLDDPKEPFKILKRRSIQRHNMAVTEVLIQWKGEAMEEATWELLYKLKLQFPYFDVTAVP
ncbi:hypothetical protein KIW84_052187 [Lathyrus oleraceus]|uniref:Uncharacterized protein n=1 Tax=Pisum sativum TaxID=3888 RepID=A0A9D4WP88_PEA|nr:hypothetical protein KIW84_052187 [Pisum sativum]